MPPSGRNNFGADCTETHPADTVLPDLLHKITRCERYDPMTGGCGVHYEGLHQGGMARTRGRRRGIPRSTRARICAGEKPEAAIRRTRCGRRGRPISATPPRAMKRRRRSKAALKMAAPTDHLRRLRERTGTKPEFQGGSQFFVEISPISPTTFGWKDSRKSAPR